MRTNDIMLRRMINFGVVLMMGVSMNANAGWFGIGGASWKEEVLLHDGRKIIAKRFQSYGGRHEIGQTPPIKEQGITFTLPGADEPITWKSEYSEDIGRSNFLLLALHVLKATPYIIAAPNLCQSYNKWGRPNPPYVIFKYEANAWTRIPLQQLPAELQDINLIVETKADEKKITSQSIVSVDLIKKLNSSRTQPEYRSILREPVKQGTEGSSVNCPELVFYKGAWVGPGGSIGKRMMDLRTK